MATTDEERKGVLVLRAWVEANGKHGLRVRITQIQDGMAEPVSSASATVDGVCTMVRIWLEELQNGRQLRLPPDDR